MSPSKQQLRQHIKCPLCQSASDRSYVLSHTSVFRCSAKSCELQFAHPQLDDQALGRAYETYYYPTNGNNTHLLENSTEHTVQQLFRAIKPASISLAGRRVLDYGCGTGTLLRAAANAGAQAVGIEQSAAARDTIAKAGFAEAFKDLDDLLRKDPNIAFDVIFLSDVIEHLRRPWDELREVGKLLAPGGSVVLTTPNSESLRARLSGKDWDQRQNPTHFYYFTPATLTLVLREAGFQQVTPLKAISDYEHHGTLRRSLQHALLRLGLQGGLLFVAGNYVGARESYSPLAGISRRIG